MIGILGAMEEEISVILSEMSDISVDNYKGLIFYKGNLLSKEVVLVKAGIGMVNSSISTTLLIEKYKADKIIFSGVAGGLSKDLKVLDIVIGDSFVEYGFDVTAFGYKKGQRAGTKERDIRASEEMIEITKHIDTKVHYGRIASSDVFVDSFEEKLRIKNEFEASAVDMESAAVAHVCELFNIPYLIIRSISDTLGDDSELEYKEFVNIASNQSKNYLLEIIKRV